METYQARLHKEQTDKIHSETLAIEQSRGSASVGYGNGVAGITVRDMSLRTTQTNLTLKQIDQLMADLAEARKHLVFCELVDSIS